MMIMAQLMTRKDDGGQMCVNEYHYKSCSIMCHDLYKPCYRQGIYMYNMGHTIHMYNTYIYICIITYMYVCIYLKRWFVESCVHYLLNDFHLGQLYITL